MCVIKCIDPTGYTYYIADGGCYYVNCEKYVCITETFEQAKRYKSPATARNAYNKLYNSCVNLTDEYKLIEY